MSSGLPTLEQIIGSGLNSVDLEGVNDAVDDLREGWQHNERLDQPGLLTMSSESPLPSAQQDSDEDDDLESVIEVLQSQAETPASQFQSRAESPASQFQSRANSPPASQLQSQANSPC